MGEGDDLTQVVAGGSEEVVGQVEITSLLEAIALL